MGRNRFPLQFFLLEDEPRGDPAPSFAALLLFVAAMAHNMWGGCWYRPHPCTPPCVDTTDSAAQRAAPRRTQRFDPGGSGSKTPVVTVSWRWIVAWCHRAPSHTPTSAWSRRRRPRVRVEPAPTSSRLRRVGGSTGVARRRIDSRCVASRLHRMWMNGGMRSAILGLPLGAALAAQWPVRWLLTRGWMRLL